MVGEIDDVDANLAAAVGFYALCEASLHEAAERAGVTSWELEDAIMEAGLGEQFGIEREADLTDEIDRLLDDGS